MNIQQEPYGEERLVPLLEQQSCATPVVDVVQAVTESANAFANGAPASDDMTVLCVRYCGTS
jgi:serine phosphatase RsbU (regulator of sigma subunit)